MSHEPWGMSHWALSYEPWTINKKNEWIIRLYIIGLRYYQKIISCFQVHIGPIFKIFKKLLDGPSSVSGACLFETCQTNNFRNYQISKNNMFPKCFHDFLICFEVFRYNKMNKYGAPGPRKSRNHGIWSFWCFK